MTLAEALNAAIEVAEDALRHDETALGIVDGEGIVDDEEAQEERDWIAEQRATLDRLRSVAATDTGIVDATDSGGAA